MVYIKLKFIFNEKINISKIYTRYADFFYNFNYNNGNYCLDFTSNKLLRFCNK